MADNMPPSTAQSHDMATLAARWMQWAAVSSVFKSPILDESGAQAGRRQPRDVWFFAGTMGGAVGRNFTVPAGRRLFGPAFCIWSPDLITVPEIDPAFGSVRVDGREVETARVGAGPVEIRGSILNPVTRIPWRPYPMHIVGIWADIDPLGVGTHSLEIRGGDGNGFETSVDAIIQVD